MEADHIAGSMASCHVYVAALSLLRPDHWCLLDETERLRAGRYVHPGDRDRFVLGALLVRFLAARANGGTPDAAVVDRTCCRCGEPHGKPRLVGVPLEISIAHSGAIVAIAVSGDGSVGLDVEAQQPFDYRRVLPDVCADDEQGFVGGLDDFYVYWTRKEAFLKATGAGMLHPMREVGVTPPGSPPTVVHVGVDAPPAARLADLRPDVGYAGAVAVLTSLPLVCRSHDAAELLGAAVPIGPAATASSFALDVQPGTSGLRG